MWGILRFFKESEKRWIELDESLTRAFEKLKSESSHVFSWLNYLKEKDVYNDKRHELHSKGHELLTTEIARQKADLLALKACLRQASAEINELKMQKGQVRTTQGTSEDNSRDKSGTPTERQEEQKTEKIIHPYDKSMLSSSELEVLNVLYHADKPLSYFDISKQLNKTEKSIRNLIYELRKRKVEVHDKPIGPRQKGFYLINEVKIKISGR